MSQPNRLIHAVSPYLRQHAHNPVDWYEWGAEALARAKAEDKPILVSIGYSACHWCHVMEAESFSDPATAALMNQLFINIKVDREERPDIDQIYMGAVQALTGRGGWPLNVFLLPDGTPFYGGTYFPPAEKAARYRMPSWAQVLEGVSEAYTQRRADVVRSGAEILAHVARISAPAVPPAARPPLAQVVNDALEQLVHDFDPLNGGFSDAPKFPQPMTLEFLLQMHARGDQRALPMLQKTLDAMAEGGMYDHLGGGFHRYSVDAIWLVPHFEKMLYDNGLLAKLYLDAHLATGEPRYRTVAEETLDYLLREMRAPEGGFFSAQDADSLPHAGAAHGEEGVFFVWSPEELAAHLGSDAPLFAALYDVTAQGNFEGQSILNRRRPLAEVAAETGVNPLTLAAVGARGRALLLAARSQRIPPATDDKILSGWNGLALRAFARAAAALNRQDYLVAAQGCARFILQQLLRPDGRLLRSWRAGVAGATPAFLDDHALVGLGLLELHAADGDPQWLVAAIALAEAALARFWVAEQAAFYDTANDHEQLVSRPREISDNAVPAGNSAICELLLLLHGLTGEARYLAVAEQVIGGLAPALGRYPSAFGRLLCAADLLDQPLQELALVGTPDDPATQALLAVAYATHRPRLVIGRAAPGTPAPVALLAERTAVNQPTAYLCSGLSCRLPVTDPAALAEQFSAEE